MTKFSTESASNRREGPLPAEVPRDEEHLNLERPPVQIQRGAGEKHPGRGINPPFHAGPHWWHQNRREGREAYATPALLTTPTGEQVTGVAIMRGREPLVVATTSDALRIANEVADVLAGLNTEGGRV